MENSNTVEFIVKIPETVVPLIEYAAKAQGWRPTVADANGQPIDNPTSAIAHVFTMVVQVIKGNAINAYANEEAEKARQKVVQQMELAANEWLLAMPPGNQ